MAEGANQQILVCDKSTDKTCKRCRKIAQTGPKCVKCGIVSHTSCASILKLPSVGDNLINCCLEEKIDNDSVSDSSFLSSAEDSDQIQVLRCEIFYLKKLVNDKDLLIKNQQLTIKVLNDHVDILKNQEKKVALTPSYSTARNKLVNNNIVTALSSTAKPIKSAKPVNPSLTVCEQDGVNDNNDNNKFSDNQAVHTASGNSDKKKALSSSTRTIKHTDTVKSKTSELVYNQNVPNTSHKVKKYERSKNTRHIIGNQISDTTLVAVPKPFALHVYRLHPDTNQLDVKNHLNKTFPEVQVEKLNSKFPELYSSFKVSIPRKMKEEALDPSIWPSGSCVKPFFQKFPRPMSEK